MKDEKLIEKIKKELLSIQNQIDECYERREKLMEDYTKRLLNFEVVDLDLKQAVIPKRH
jgi:hypothetical protein